MISNNLMRYFKAEKELDVFINGVKVYTFTETNYFNLELEEFLENLGIKNFEKEVCEKRNTPRIENVQMQSQAVATSLN